jgi:hypothetical protein
MKKDKSEDRDRDLEDIDSYFKKCLPKDISSYGDPIRRVSELVERYRATKNLEVEIRLGYFKGNNFEPTVSENFFEKIRKNLDSSDIFKVTTEETTDFYNKDSIRKTVVSSENNISLIKKTRLHTVDYTFEGTPYDIRFSFSKETPVKIFEEPVIYTRNKKRTSYQYKVWKYDLTEVSYIENSLPIKKYEVELEIVGTLNSVLKNMSKYYLIHSSLLKIKDISNFCEDEDSEINFLYKSEKNYSE